MLTPSVEFIISGILGIDFSTGWTFCSFPTREGTSTSFHEKPNLRKAYRNTMRASVPMKKTRAGKFPWCNIMKQKYHARDAFSSRHRIFEVNHLTHMDLKIWNFKLERLFSWLFWRACSHYITRWSALHCRQVSVGCGEAKLGNINSICGSTLIPLMFVGKRVLQLARNRKIGGLYYTKIALLFGLHFENRPTIQVLFLQKSHQYKYSIKHNSLLSIQKNSSLSNPFHSCSQNVTLNIASLMRQLLGA